VSNTYPSQIKPHSADPVGDWGIWRLAWPIILANSTTPLLGLVDTAVIGNTGRNVDLGAIALGSLIFSFLYWSFGFLRMGTTGFTARADGAGDSAEVRAILGRALLVACVIGVLLILLQWPVATLSLQLLGAGPDTESLTRDYLLIRIWSAPASLALYVCMGLLIGLGQSGRLLQVQLFVNGLNILLDVLFAGLLRWGVAGIAVGTAIAEWMALLYAGWVSYRLLRQRHADREAFWPWWRIFDLPSLRRTLSANTDILIRTLALLFGFAWFTDQSARFGDLVLAGNHLLLQLLSFSAFFLDGFAFAAETLVGRATGMGRRDLFEQAVLSTSRLAAVTAILLSLILLTMGPLITAGLTDLSEVRDTAERYLPYAAVYVLLSVAAFQLDGIFIGTTATRYMRNASLISVMAFLIVWWPLSAWLGNAGLWLAFILFVIARALTLGLRYPALRDGLVDAHR
jgi:MATE family multidrug resistance protein